MAKVDTNVRNLRSESRVPPQAYTHKNVSLNSVVGGIMNLSIPLIELEI